MNITEEQRKKYHESLCETCHPEGPCIQPKVETIAIIPSGDTDNEVGFLLTQERFDKIWAAWNRKGSTLSAEEVRQLVDKNMGIEKWNRDVNKHIKEHKLKCRICREREDKDRPLEHWPESPYLKRKEKVDAALNRVLSKIIRRLQPKVKWKGIPSDLKEAIVTIANKMNNHAGEWYAVTTHEEEADRVFLKYAREFGADLSNYRGREGYEHLSDI